MNKLTAPYPLLERSYKDAFPFKIATTSFVYPDRYAPNVRLLGPFLDEIEILFFESPDITDTQLPQEVQTLDRLADIHNLTYNIHLPLDVALSAASSTAREKAVDVLRHVIRLTATLNPTTLTLHLPYTAAKRTTQDVLAWQTATANGLDLLLATGITPDKISIETLDYPFEWAAPLIDDFGLTVCLDIGHLLAHGFDVEAVFNAHAHRTAIIHLHGLSDGHDHLPLDRMSPHHWERLVPILRNYRGVVSLEVFSFDYLERSLKFLKKYWTANID